MLKKRVIALMPKSIRRLILIFGDQLQHDSAALKDFDPDQDCIWMAEVEEELTHVWCHKLRIAMFLSAMRHFRDELRDKGYQVEYHELTVEASKDRGKSFGELLKQDLQRFQPEQVRMVTPGDERVLQQVTKQLKKAKVDWEELPDEHFYCSPQQFAEYAQSKKELRLEYFYRWLRKEHQILIDEDGEPVGGEWNYDHDNREPLPKSGPEPGLTPLLFKPDEVTQEVIDLVSERFAEHPGSLDHFDLPVTRKQALKKLDHFIKERLPNFGTYEDALWTDETYLYHSHLSACMNLKLLNPRECVEKAVAAYDKGKAEIHNVEGFVRQILGWREFVRGIYWHYMPDYAEKNELDATLQVPHFFWDGETDLECVRQSMQHVIEHGYSHHIHRLMVLGNLALMLGVHPYAFHEWHMAMYLDAIDWVSLPNTLGMSQFGDGGIVGTKPYCSTGNYVHKMSNFCKNCRYDYRKKTGKDACPLTTLYWDFLDRNYDHLKDNRRMTFQLKNVERLRKDKETMQQVRERSEELREEWER